MSEFVIKPKSITKTALINKEYLLTPSRHKYVEIKNKNSLPISEIFSESKQSINIEKNKGYYNYIEIGSINNNIGTVIPKLERSIDISTNSVSRINFEDILISTVRTYLGGIGIISKKTKNTVASKALIVLRDLKIAKDRYYLFGLLRSIFFIEQVSIILNASMYPRMERDYFKNLYIPFPTKNNYLNPELIEKYVSYLTQIIIHKEELIEQKLNEINSLIENELKNSTSNFKFKNPNKTEVINKNFRLDTGLYKPEFKINIDSIKNYDKGFYRLNELKKTKWISGSTPSTLIETNSKSDKLWIAVADINYGLTYKRLKSFKLKDKINSIQNGDILITRKGATVGKMIIYFDTGHKEAFVNEDIKVLRIDKSIDEKIFLGLFLNSKYGQVQMLSNGSKGTKQGLTNPNILNVIVPKFSENFKKNLAKKYNSEIPKTPNLDIDNYLKTEKSRNEKLGIAQLNLECFELIEKLNNIIHKIIKEEPITIEL